MLKFIHLSLLFCLVPQQQGVLRPCHLHTWLSLGHFKPPSRHTHAYIYKHTHTRFIPPLPLGLSFLCLSLSLSHLLSSPVQCSVSESLKSIPDHFLWHTQQKPVCQLLRWQDEAKLPQKVVWVYVSICKFELWECNSSLHASACMWCWISEGGRIKHTVK